MRYEDQSQPTQPLGGAAPTPAEHYTRRMSDPPATPRPPRATPRDSTTWPSTTSIWQRWIGVTMLAGVLVAIFGGISVFAGQQIAPPLVSWTVAGTAAGLIVGLLQAVALSDYLPKRACTLWIVLTTLVGVSEGVFSGWTFTIQTLTIPFHTTEATGQMEGGFSGLDQIYIFIALQSSAFLHLDPIRLYDSLRAMTPLICALAYGAVPGIAQWFVLRNYLQRAYWWVIANMVSGLIIAALFPLVAGMALLVLYVTILCAGLPAGLLLGAALGLPVGVLLGGVMAWLVSQTLRSQPRLAGPPLDRKPGAGGH
jgi:hypothetical protein